MMLNEYPHPTSQEWAWSRAEDLMPLIALDLAGLGYGISEGMWDKRGMNGLGAPWMPYSGMGRLGQATLLPAINSVTSANPGATISTAVTAACDPNCSTTNPNDGSGCCVVSASPSIPNAAQSYSFTDSIGTVWNCSGSGICTPNYSSSSTSSGSGISTTTLLVGAALVAALFFMGRGN